MYITKMESTPSYKYSEITTRIIKRILLYALSLGIMIVQYWLDFLKNGKVLTDIIYSICLSVYIWNQQKIKIMYKMTLCSYITLECNSATHFTATLIISSKN